MPLLEANVSRNACCQSVFKYKYHSGLKKFISKTALKSDIKDINKAYRATQTCDCIYSLVPLLSFFGGIAWLMWSLIKHQKQKHNIGALSLMAGAIALYIVGLCYLRCSQKSGHKNVKKFLKDINGERKYKKNGMHWELDVCAGIPRLLLLEGNAKAFDKKRSSKEIAQKRRSEREKLKESIQRSQQNQREDYADEDDEIDEEMEEELGVDDLD